MLVRPWQILGFIFRQRLYVYIALFALLFFSHQPNQTPKSILKPVKTTYHSLSLKAVPSIELSPKASEPNDSSTQVQPSVSAWQRPVVPTPTPKTQSAAIPVVTKIDTSEPVVFLGIDDGWAKSQEAKDWLLAHHLPFSLFLTNEAIKDNYTYFQELQQAGMTIEDHTLTHPDFTNLTLDQQKAEICGAADIYNNVFGHRPTLFRPTYGEPNNLTDEAAAECGMKAIIMWSAKANGGSIQFQDNHTALVPGDIVLMHFRPEFIQDMNAFMNDVQKSNLQIGRLEDWLL